ncbi:hypothetical protein RKD26_003703 [Streptomyces calvus]
MQEGRPAVSAGTIRAVRCPVAEAILSKSILSKSILSESPS